MCEEYKTLASLALFSRVNSEFVTFRTQDVGEQGHLERIAGKRSNGSWDTAVWLIAKEDAHVQGKTLVIDNPKSRTVLKQISGPITLKKRRCLHCQTS